MLNGKKIYVVIGAAGTGRRMSSPVPKQFLRIDGKTILEMTVEKFSASPLIDEIVVAAAAEYQDLCRRLFADLLTAGRLSVIEGGQERQDSISRAIGFLQRKGVADESILLIHDAVRPFVSQALIRRIAEKTMETGAAVPAVPPKDTIRHTVMGTLERDRLYCVQTPQGFRMSLIRQAFAQAEADGFYGTDDAGLAERAGFPVALTEGETANIKITTPEDLPMENRIGTGFDVHRLCEGRKLILGGEEIPFEKGLLGHSDADVLLHALMDAMLGAAALGDIGKWFPDSDERYRGISSMKLLEETGRIVREAGYCLGNADVTVICQRPRLAEHIGAMRKNIADALGVSAELISIKATTTEKLGFTGRGEGIAAEAVCLLKRGW